MVDIYSRIRWVATGLIVVLIAVLGLVWLTFRQTVAAEAAATWVAHTNDVLFHTSRLQYLLNENQALVRDYAFTGDETKPERIIVDEKRVDSVLLQLAELLKDNQLQQKQLDTAKRLITARLAFTRQQIKNYRENGLGAFIKTASAGHGIALMDSIRTVLSAIQENENRLLAERNLQTTATQTRLNWLKSGLFLGLFLLSITILYFVVQQLRAQKKVEAILKGANQSLETEVHRKSAEISGTLEQINAYFIAVDKNWKITYINQRARELVKGEPGEYKGQVLWDAFPNISGTKLQQSLLQAAKSLQPFTESLYASRQQRWLEVYGYPDSKGIALYLHDITARKEAEQRIETISRLYYFISQINQMIVRTESRDQLFRDACVIAVKEGGFPLVWIGEPDEKGRLQIKYSDGEKQGYLELLNEITIHDEPSGRGPSGRAFREQKPIMGPDIQHAPESAPWREQAIRFGLRSSMSFPLFLENKPVAVMTFYSDQQAYFNERETELLTGVVHDISYALSNIHRENLRKAAENELRERNQFISSLIDTSPDIIYIYDLKNQENVYVNREIFRGLGYTVDEIRQMGNSMLSRLMHPDDLIKYQKETLPAYAKLPDGKIHIQEFRICDTSGNWHWFYCKEAIYKRDASGNPEQIFGLISDITELKRIELELRRSKEQYRSMIDRISDGFIVLDRYWKYVYVNSQIEKMVHKPASDLIGRNIWEVFPDAIGSNTYKTFLKAMEDQVYVRSVDYYPPLDLWQENHIYPSPDGLAVFILDISQRKLDERKLEQSEEKYRILFENSPLPLWIYSMRNLRFLEVNDAAITFYGYSREEFLNRSILDIRPESEKKKAKAAAEQLYHGFHAAGKWTHRKKDGSLTEVYIYSHETIYLNEVVRLVIAVPVTG